MSAIRTPQQASEIPLVLPPGEDERIAGWGVMGLSFESGDYLALRCMTPSFGDDDYRALWHRNPAGEWTVHSTADPAHSCERYIGAACTHPSVRTGIATEWLDDRTLHVTTDQLDWTIALGRTPVTRMMSLIGRLMPHWMWTNRLVLALMGRMAGPMLRVGKVRLAGDMPNGQKFTAAPVHIWSVVDSRAVLNGRDLGRPAGLAKQTRLGGFWLPQRGIFMRGFGHFETFDPERHVSAAQHQAELLAAAS